MAKKAGADAIWTPDINDIFPNGTDGHFQLEAPQRISQTLCGKRHSVFQSFNSKALLFKIFLQKVEHSAEKRKIRKNRTLF